MPRAKLENTCDIDPALENGTSINLDYRLCEMVIYQANVVCCMRICHYHVELL